MDAAGPAASPLLPSREASTARPRSYVKEALNTDKDIFVIKVGTSSLVRPEHHSMNISALARLCEAVKELKSQGHHVIIVTSGAVGVGCQHLHIEPEAAKRRALAAIGQVQLIKYYEDFLGALGMTCAQLLLTADNLAVRGQYLAARTTFTELLSYGVVPVVNENDTVAVQELRFGDNDTLSAQVAALVQADWLFLLTDVDCLYTANPKDDPNAQPIYEVEDIARLNADTSTKGTQWGTGGMATKLTAGRIATAAGCTMVICNSCTPENIVRIAQGEPMLGTKFHPLPHNVKGKKRWILSVPVRGTLELDASAVRHVRDKHMPLVAAGITKVTGSFDIQECVSLVDCHGVELARGLVSIPAEDLNDMLQLHRDQDQRRHQHQPSAHPQPYSKHHENGGEAHGRACPLLPSGGSDELGSRRTAGGSSGGRRRRSSGCTLSGGVAGAYKEEEAFDVHVEVVVHRGNLVLLAASEDAGSEDGMGAHSASSAPPGGQSPAEPSSLADKGPYSAGQAAGAAATKLKGLVVSDGVPLLAAAAACGGGVRKGMACNIAASATE